VSREFLLWLQYVDILSSRADGYLALRRWGADFAGRVATDMEMHEAERSYVEKLQQVLSGTLLDSNSLVAQGDR
jgi:hypothetical protein